MRALGEYLEPRLLLSTIESSLFVAESAPTAPLRIVVVSDEVTQAKAVASFAQEGSIAVVYPSRTVNSLSDLVGLLESVAVERGAAPISHLALVAHGRSGQIDIGQAYLDLDSLWYETAALDRLAALLTDDARLDLYACQVAAERGGRAFVDALSLATGATVFASDNPVGSGQGADFEWEYQAGSTSTRGDLLSENLLDQISGLVLDDAYEPNNTRGVVNSADPSGANSPNLGVLTQTKTISNLVMESGGEPDWFRFETTETGTSHDFIRIEFVDSQGDLDLDLHKSDGASVGMSISLTADFEEVSLAEQPPGEYYARVHPKLGQTNPGYTLIVNPPGNSPDDDYEENDTRLEAKNALPGAVDSPNLGLLQSTWGPRQLALEDSADWFTFQTNQIGTSHDFVRIDFPEPDGDLDLELYNDNGAIPPGRFSRSASNNFEHISLAALPPSTYHVRVYGKNGDAHSEYSLTVDPPGNSPDDLYEPNDTQAEVDLLFHLLSPDFGEIIGAKLVSNLALEDSADWFRFETIGTGTDFNDIRIEFDPSKGDLDLELLGEFGGRIAFSMIDTHPWEYITLSGRPAGTYYIKVFGKNGDANPEYDLIIHAPTAPTPEILVTPTSGLSTTESGGVAKFSVRLTSKPSDDVVIGLSVNDPSEGAVSPASLVFTPNNWNTAQQVTVTGVDDDAEDGDIAYTVITAPAVSEDPDYDGLNPPNVSVTNKDNDSSNAPPTISNLPDQTTDVDMAVGPITFTVTDSQTPATALSVTAATSNPVLLPLQNIVFGGAGANRTVTLTPASGRSGSSLVTLSVSDGALSSSDSFLLTVTGPNDPPTISAVADRTTNENTSTGPIAFTINDLETAANDLTVSAASSNTALAPVSNIILGGAGSNRTVTVTPTPNMTGAATITLIVSDGQASAAETFELTVSGANSPPTISPVANVTVNEDTTVVRSFTVGDIETSADLLTVTAFSTNEDLAPAANVSIIASGAQRTISVTPAANQAGMTTIVLAVSDGETTVTEPFTITVIPVNDPPTITALADTAIDEDTSTMAFTFSVADVESAADALTVTVDSSNPSLVPLANVLLGMTGADRTVTVMPAADQSGVAVITLLVSDGEEVATEEFLLTVEPTPDAPTALSPTSGTVNEDLPGAEIAQLSVDDPDPEANHSFVVSDARFEVVDYVLKLKPGESLDFETEPTVTLQITISEPGSPPLELSELFVLNVADVEEPLFPWQNMLLRWDVDNDGAVGIGDVLPLVSFLRERGLDAPLPTLFPRPDGPPPYLDVDGNNRCSLNDLLEVIQRLREQQSAAPAGEGEVESIIAVGRADAETASGQNLDDLRLLDRAIADDEEWLSERPVRKPRSGADRA